MVLRRLLALLLLGLAGGASAADGDGARATLYAGAYAEIPAGAAVAIRFRSASALDAGLRALVAAKLRARGLAVADDAALRLTVDSDIAAVPAGQGPLGVQGRAGTGGVESLRFSLQVPFEGLAGRPALSRYRVDVTLGEAGAGPIWQGTALARVPGGREPGLAARLVAALLDHLGESIRGDRMVLD